MRRVAGRDDECKRMQFRREVKHIKAKYEELLTEKRGEEEVPSD